ncbi:MAG: peptidoglycan-binding domain-containing protein [Patescibacteria group bacterium]
MNKTLSKVTSVALSATTIIWLTGAAAFVPVAFAQSTSDEIASLQALITSLTSQLSALQGSSTTPVVVPTASGACSFTRSLTVGMKGDDVLCLQKYLNSAGFALATSGAGSPGSETTYFGPITKAAVVKWQNANVAGVLTPVNLSVGTGYFGPSSRSYYSSLMAGTVTPVVPGTPVTPVVPVVPVGGLMVSLAASNPASANVPKGAAEVPYITLTLYGTGTVSEMTFKRVGQGLAADFVSGGVKLYEGGSRITTGKSVNSTTHEVIFPNLNLAVSGSRTLTLTADMAAAATGGNINAFDLISVVADKTVSGVPLQSNQMVVSGATVGGVTAAKQSSLSNPTVGQVGAKVSEFKLTANSVEDLYFRRVTLTNGGTITSGHLTNLVLKQAGTVVGTTAATHGDDMYTIELSEPFKILKGQNRTFEVYADVSPLAKSAETIKLYLDLTNDVYVTGATYGFGATVTNSFDSTAANHHVLILRGAELTITFHGPVTRDIPAKAQDVTLFDFSVSTKNNIEVRQLDFTLTTTNIVSGDGFTDFKVVDADTGSAVTSSVDITETDGSESESFTDRFNISAGTTRHFLVTADVDPDNDGSETILVQLDAIGASDVRNLDNNTYIAVTDIVPNANIVGNIQTVQAVSLTTTLSGSPASHNVVKGTSNEEIFAFNLKAQNGDVKMTSVTISASATTGTAAQLRNDLRTVGLYADGVLLGSKQNFAADGTVSDATFSNVDYTIPEGQNKKFILVADQIATDATTSNAYYAYINDLSTELTAVDVEGNTLTLSGTVNGADGTAGTVVITVTAPTIRVDAVTDQETEAGLIVANGERLLGKFEFYAANAASLVTKLRVGVATDTNANESTTLVDEVKEIRLYAGGTLLASGIPAGSGVTGGSVVFENTNGLFTVGANETKQVEVRALIDQIDGTTSKADSGTNMPAVVASADFEAVAGTTKLTTLSGSTATGAIKRLYRSIPTVTVSSPSTSTLTVGQVELLQFTVAADAAGDIDWTKLEFTTALSQATFTVSTSASQTIDVRYAGTDLTLTTATLAVGGGEGVILLTTPERIAAGTSKTYSLLATIGELAGSTTASSVSTALDGDATAFVTPAALLTNVVTATNSFVWTDRGIAPHSTTSLDWHNDHQVKLLPSGTKALSK